MVRFLVLQRRTGSKRVNGAAFSTE